MQVSCEFSEHSIEKQPHYFLTIAPQKSCKNPAKRKGAFDEKSILSMKYQARVQESPLVQIHDHLSDGADLPVQMFPLCSR